MAAHSSISQSIQSSIFIAQHQLQPQEQDGELQQHQHGKGQKGAYPKMSLLKKLMLTAALFGTEATTAFEQVFTYLSLQYLGVPVSLMSVNGIVAGCLGILLIPLMGLLTDRGSNPQKRKMIALLAGVCCTLAGAIVVIAACTLKILSTAAIVDDLRPESLDTGHYSWSVSPIPETVSLFHTDILESQAGKGIGNDSAQNIPRAKTRNESISEPWLATVSSGNRSSSENLLLLDIYEYQTIGLPNSGTNDTVIISNVAEITLKGALGILGYILLDFGFDIGNPFVRAYVLDHTPPADHTNLLVTATLMASSAGTLISLLGVFDLSSVLSETFHVDGTAATFILLIAVLVCIIISCNVCTILTGKAIKKEMLSDMTTSEANHDQSRGMTPTKINSSTKRTESMHSDIKDVTGPAIQEEVSDNEEEQGVDKEHNERSPLLPGQQTTNDNRYNMSFSVSVSAFIPNEIESRASQSGFNISTATGVKGVEESDMSNSSRPRAVTGDHIHILQDEFSKKDIPARPRVGSELSISNAVAPLGDFHNKKLDYLTSTSNKTNKPTPFWNKRLVILLMASTFSMSSMICFVMYIPNALTLGIYAGDPLAVLGTPENENYKAGLRAAALGSLIFYVCYFITCVFNIKIFETIGERVHFIICHIALATSTLVLMLVQRVEVYLVAMAMFGPFRTCVYTLPFVLANKYTQDKNQSSKGKHVPNTRAGRVMSLIGALLPSNYIIVSSIMGPLIDVTGSVWVPIIWSTICNVISIIIFSALFFVSPD